MIALPLPWNTKLLYRKRTGGFGRERYLPAYYRGPTDGKDQTHSMIDVFYIDGTKKLVIRRMNYVSNTTLMTAADWLTLRKGSTK
jgi:hypothetical protein